MPKAPLLQIDNLDDRREAVTTLERLSPSDRLRWLASCCRQVTGPHGDRVRVARHDTGESAVGVAMDFWQLVSQYDLDPQSALARLEHLARKRGCGRRLWAAASNGTTARQ